MCVAAAGPLLGMGAAGQIGGGLLEQLGDPLGTKKARDESQQAKWAREDKIREAGWAHEERLAGIQYGGGNRSKLNAGSSSSGTGTPTSTRGGGRSSPGSAQSSKY